MAAMCPESDSAFLDVRPEEAFLRGHAPAAANVPLESLERRIHELPTHDREITVFDTDPGRAGRAAEFLRAGGWRVLIAASAPPGPEVSGPSRVRLWRPNAFLCEVLPRLLAQLEPDSRRAVDIACGAGRDAVFLAEHGFEVEAIDVLPDALERAQDLARRSGVRLTTRLMDVENAPSIAAGSYDLICVFNFLFRPLLPLLEEALRPGGFLVYETFHERQHELFGKPRRRERCAGTRELPALVPHLEVQDYREGLVAPRRFVASLLARRPPVAP